MADTVTDVRQDQDEDAGKHNLLTQPVPRDTHGRILPGYSLNPHGRIRKKPTVWDETQRLATKAKERKAVARAHVNTMKLEDAAGNRARADYHDRDIGKVVQGYVISVGETPADALYADLASLLTITVEGEAKLLPPAGIT